MFCNGVCSAGTVKVLNFYNLHFTVQNTIKKVSHTTSPCLRDYNIKVTKTLSHANYISSGQLIIDRLAGHIEPRGGPHVGPRAVGWTTLCYSKSESFIILKRKIRRKRHKPLH